MAAAQTMAMTTTQKIIAIAVTIIIISTVAIPVIQDMQSSYVHTDQNAGETFTMIPKGDSVTLSSVDGQAAINGVSVRTLLPDLSSGMILVLSDVLVANVYWSNDSASTWYITSPALLPGETNLSTTLGASDSIQFSSGSATYSKSGASPVTGSYTYLFIQDDEGSYGAWHPPDIASDGIHVDSKSKIYAFQRTTSNSFAASGTLEEMEIDFMVRSGNVDTSSTIATTYTLSDDGASNVLTAVTISPTYNYNTAGYIVAPLDYTVLSDSATYDLIGVIPILLILVPLMMAVRMMALKRN